MEEATATRATSAGALKVSIHRTMSALRNGLQQWVMAMETERLIQTLVGAATPVRPLPPVWIRCALWLTIAVPYVTLVVYVMSPRPDLIVKLTEARYVFDQLAALVTCVAAAIAAFATTIPGYSRKMLLLPVLPLTAWLGSLGQGSVSAWLLSGPDGMKLQPDWFCFPAIVLVGAIPAIAMVIMLRRGVPLVPATTGALGGLAAAGLGDFGLRFFYPQDASLMVLVWQFGTVFVVATLSACTGRYILNWPARMAIAPRPMATD